MAVPKNIQQLLVQNLSRVKINLQSLGMVAEAVIGGVCFLAAGVANPGSDDSLQTPKLGVWSPESAKGKGGGFKITRRGKIDSRQSGFVFSQ